MMSTSRPYRSRLRQDRAEDTKLRIRTAARDLFAVGGFTNTTIAQIADRAGVAPQTVFAVFGSKGGIVTAMLEELEESAGRDGWVARIVAEPDAHRQLRLFVSWIRTLFEQGTPILRAALTARSDPDVAALADRGDQARREGTNTLANLWSDRGMLRSGLEPDDATQRLWLLTSLEQYLFAIDRLGWDPDRYERWLGDLLEREILQPR